MPISWAEKSSLPCDFFTFMHTVIVPEITTNKRVGGIQKRPVILKIRIWHVLAFSQRNLPVTDVAAASFCRASGSFLNKRGQKRSFKAASTIGKGAPVPCYKFQHQLPTKSAEIKFTLIFNAMHMPDFMINLHCGPLQCLIPEKCEHCSSMPGLRQQFHRRHIISLIHTASSTWWGWGPPCREHPQFS